jgi:hypothetical protein
MPASGIAAKNRRERLSGFMMSSMGDCGAAAG